MLAKKNGLSFRLCLILCISFTLIVPLIISVIGEKVTKEKAAISDKVLAALLFDDQKTADLETQL